MATYQPTDTTMRVPPLTLYLMSITSSRLKELIEEYVDMEVLQQIQAQGEYVLNTSLHSCLASSLWYNAYIGSALPKLS